MRNTSHYLDRRSFIAGTTAAGAGYIFASQLAAQASTLPRKAADTLTAAELQLLRDAVKVLKVKDQNGPAMDGWAALADPHSQNCFTNDANEIHYSWSFLPWHRAYLIAVERRLQNVVNQPNLRLPYWDWFTQDQIPDSFAKPTYVNAAGQTIENPLFDKTRAKTPAERSVRQEVGFTGVNREKVTRVVLGNTASELDLMRSPIFNRIGGGTQTGQSGGAIENGPHGNIHIWVGGTHDVLPGRLGGNMGQEFSPLDPVFLLHHGNIDRLWTVWRNLSTGGPHNNPTDAAWLNRTFPMPDAAGNGVKMYKVSEMLDTTQLGYNYDKETVDMPPAAAPVAVAAAGNPVSIVMNSAPLDVSSGIAQTETRTLSQPGAAPAAAPSAGTLVLSGVKLPKHTVSFSVYAITSDNAERSDDNLVAMQTILNPKQRELGPEGGVSIIVPIPERILAKIAAQPDVAFAVVVGDAPTPAAAPTAASTGFSIGEVKLELE